MTPSAHPGRGASAGACLFSGAASLSDSFYLHLRGGVSLVMQVAIVPRGYAPQLTGPVCLQRGAVTSKAAVLFSLVTTG